MSYEVSQPIINWPYNECGFKFQKRSQLFIGSHNETLPVAAMRVNGEDRSPFAIEG